MKGPIPLLRPLLLAGQFLSSIPLPTVAKPSADELGRSLLYYPLIGLFLGLVLAATAYLLHPMFSHSLSAILILALWIIMTGALHLDGFADTVDAWAGGLGSRERTLDIMKDPNSGPMAVTALVLLLLLKAQALASLFLLSNNLLLLLIAPVLARLDLLVLFLTTPYVRPQGLGEVLTRNFPRRPALSLCLIIPTLMFFLAPLLAFKLLVGNGLIFILLRRMMINRIGGCTGDTAGALVEIMELCTLLLLVAHFA